jgi:hypothetical protein
MNNRLLRHNSSIGHNSAGMTPDLPSYRIEYVVLDSDLD